jgi:hypothetical protein
VIVVLFDVSAFAPLIGVAKSPAEIAVRLILSKNNMAFSCFLLWLLFMVILSLVVE